MALLYLNFISQYLDGNTDVNIILPDRPRDKTSQEFYGGGKNTRCSGCCTAPLGTTAIGYANGVFGSGASRTRWKNFCRERIIKTVN